MLAILIYLLIVAWLLARLILSNRRDPTMSVVGEQPLADQTSLQSNGGSYVPTPMDIFISRVMLSRSKRLPPDIVDVIFDFAEYWACSISTINFVEEQQEPMRIHGRSEVEDKFLLRSYPLGLADTQKTSQLMEGLVHDSKESKPLPLQREHHSDFFTRLTDYPVPSLLHPCRKIIFSLKSKDQGFCSNSEGGGLYQSSWTWFEAGLERFDAEQDCNFSCTYDIRSKSSISSTHSLALRALRPVHPTIQPLAGRQDYAYVHPLLPQDNFEIQRNKLASKAWQEHIVTWSYLDDAKSDSDAGNALDARGRGRGTGDGSFVRGLRVGDVITLWGKARFPAWVNNIESARIDIFWAV